MRKTARPVAFVAVVAVVAACASLSAACVVQRASNEDADNGSSTSATSSTIGPAATSSTVAPADSGDGGIELRGDGLGVVALGAAPEVAIAAVSAALGEPTTDTGWESASSSHGTCPGKQIRGVEWDHLVLLFTDGDTAYGRGEHLFTWRVTGAPPALGTEKGLGYRATVSDAEELYPGAVEVTPPDDPFPGFVTITVDGGRITGYLEGDVITNLEAGAPCGE